MSVWQRALAVTRTRTSKGLGGATVMVSMVRGCWAARATIALQVMGFPMVEEEEELMVWMVLMFWWMHLGRWIEGKRFGGFSLDFWDAIAIIIKNRASQN